MATQSHIIHEDFPRAKHVNDLWRRGDGDAVVVDDESFRHIPAAAHFMYRCNGGITERVTIDYPRWEAGAAQGHHCNSWPLQLHLTNTPPTVMYNSPHRG